MKNVAIGVRLSLGFVAMLIITAAVAASGYWGTDRISRVTLEMLAIDAKIARLAEDARARAMETRRFEKDVILWVGNVARQSDYERKWLELIQRYRDDIREMEKLTDTEDRASVEAMRRDLDSYVTAVETLLADMRNGKLATPQQANGEMELHKDTIHDLLKRATDLAMKHEETMEKQADVIRGHVSSVRSTLLAILVGAIVIGVVVSLAITRSITAPLAGAVRTVEEVASASREQSTGVQQVSKAMGVVDQVTQRNASAAEELSSTAEEMSSQAEALSQLVGFFQVASHLAVQGRGIHAPHLAAPKPPKAAAAPSVQPAAHLPVPAPRNGTAKEGEFRRF